MERQDGTLTVPVIDFAAMRRAVGVPNGDILDAISSWDEVRQQEAHEKIARVEADALRRMKLMPGLVELCEMLDTKAIRRALLTRNVKKSVDYFHENHFRLDPFFPALGREFKPYKPNPHGILHILEQWDLPPEHCVMVGDSAQDDIVAGNRAGVSTILLDTEGKYKMEHLVGEERPHYYAESLHHVRSILWECFVRTSTAPVSQESHQQVVVEQ